MRLVVARRAGAWLCALLVVGCGQKGTVTFELRSPTETHLSPLADARRDSIDLMDERTGMPLGTVVRVGSGRLAIGDLPVGTFDIRLAVVGGSQLLGLARAPAIAIQAGIDQTVPLDPRKPIAYFGALELLPSMRGLLPPPDALMAIDTTLPPSPALAPIPLMSGGKSATTTAVTSDGRLLVVGAGNTVFGVSTLNHQVLRLAVIPAPTGVGGTPVIRAIAIAPGDGAALVVTDQGLAVAPLGPLGVKGDPIALQATKAPGLRRAAFHPTTGAVTVLAGPSWQGLDCNVKTPSSLYTFPLVDPPQIGATTPLPDPATDLGYDASGRLLLASPCGKGIITADGGQVVLAGSRIFAIGRSGRRVIGIPGSFDKMTVSVDPDDPTLRNVTLPFGEIDVTDGGTTGRVLFTMPSDRITFASGGGVLNQLRPIPTSLTAYEIAISPDQSHLVFANRVHYEALDTHFADVHDTFGYSFCTFNVKGDVYHLTEVDLASGAVGLQTTRGLSYTSCRTQCFYDCDMNGKNCFQQDPMPSGCFCQGGLMCNELSSEGYVAGGASIVMEGR